MGVLDGANHGRKLVHLGLIRIAILLVELGHSISLSRKLASVVDWQYSRVFTLASQLAG